MKASDFGVNLDTLPKLVLNEDAGRHMLARLNTIKTFREDLYNGKLIFFHHYLRSHLKADVPPINEDHKEVSEKLIPDYELLWTQINRMVDRHVFLMVTAFASITENILDDEDKEILNCSAYESMWWDTVYLALDADMFGSTMNYRLRNSRGGPLGLMHIVLGVEKELQISHRQHFNFMKSYLADVALDKDYGKDTRHGSDD